MNEPRRDVAVLMVAYKAEKTIPEAVESILADPVPHHLYIVDDASPVPVEKTLKESFGNIPHNISIIRFPHNKGQGAARNTGLRKILENRHEFVAIMDADDVSHPERFTKQVSFLKRNPSIAGVGTWARAIDAEGRVLGPLYNPTEPKDIRKHLFFDSCFQHPSMMLRADVIEECGFYDEKLPVTQDYDLFYRIARKFKLANLPEFLLDYRMSGTNISSTKAHLQRRMCLIIQLRNFQPRQWRWWIGTFRTALRIAMPRTFIAMGRTLQRKLGFKPHYETLFDKFASRTPTEGHIEVPTDKPLP